MARSVAGLLSVNGILELATPLSVGGAEPGELDMPLAVDGGGRFYVPGTSLAGPARHWLLRHYNDPDLVKAVFGYQDGESGHASWLVFESASVEGVRSERRDGIKIDPEWGTAARGFKFEREVLPRGSKLNFSLELWLPQNGDPFPSDAGRALLFRLLLALAEGEIAVGAAKTRGLGRLLLRDVKIWAYDFSKRRDLISWLREERSEERLLCHPLTAASKPAATGCRLVARAQWEARHRLTVQSASGGRSVDMLPYMLPLTGRTEDGFIHAVLPGSSIKGVLRAHAFKILRGLACGKTAQSICDRVFGCSQRAGRLSVPDIYQSDSPLQEKQYEDEEFSSWGERSEHLAIDRFTGAPLKGALFGTLTPPPNGWEALELCLELPTELDPAEPTEDLEDVALLLLLLRDLAQGQIAVGFGSRRGFGDLKVSHIVARCRGLAGLGELALDESGDFVGLSDDVRVALEASWTNLFNSKEHEDMGGTSSD